MHYVGIDIGSTCAKIVVINNQRQVIYQEAMATGWNSVETADKLLINLIAQGIDETDMICVATGYGRVAVPYADKTVTEITCHGKGAVQLYGSNNLLVIDIGGQDTKIISVEKSQVRDFLMNDKCSAGTGRFLEVMAATLGVSIDELCSLAACGSGMAINAMCTVFAESEVIGLIGGGAAKADIAYAIVESIVNKVYSQCNKLQSSQSKYCLTGGLCEQPYIIESLAAKLGRPVISSPHARYAGALGAALLAQGF